MATHECACGYLGDPAGACRCTPTQAQRYRARISGPLLDRLDMHVQVPRLESGDFDDRIGRGESSFALAARVAAARSARPITPPPPSRSWAGAPVRALERSAWLIAACSSSMSCRNSIGRCSRRSVSRWRQAW